MKKYCASLLLVFLLLLQTIQLSAAMYGPNKKKTVHFDWKILSTEHFEIYFYPEEEDLARETAGLAEKAYLNISRILDYYPKAKNPVFIFQNHIHFQQTNISRGVIGPGTGGFTEAFKNRVVLPYTGSAYWLDVVLTHELTHAFQFNILYGEGTRSFWVYKNYVIPLWVMEGMAEYCAENWDSYADMVMRDAIINERVQDLNMLDGFSHLDEVFLAYKSGQTAVQFLSDTYGENAVALLMKKFKAQISVGQVIKDITGKSYRQFNRAWKASLKQKYWTQIQGKRSASDYGVPLSYDNSDHFTANNGAVWSPDGKRIAFLSNRKGREQIWMMESNGKRPKVLFKGPFEQIGRSGGYGVPGKRMSWSPDGNTLAFVIAEKGKKWLALGDIATKKIRKMKLNFNEISSPDFSPDGSQLAFSAGDGFRSEIYTVEIKTKKVRQITKGFKTTQTTHPDWSPDGKWLVFSGEKESKNQIFLISLDGSERRQLSDSSVDSLMPAFKTDGEKVYYVSDKNGGYNLVETDLKGENHIVHTDVVNGLFCPVPSPKGDQILLISYEDGCQNVYRIDTPDYPGEPVSQGIQALINPYLLQPPGLTRTTAGIPDFPDTLASVDLEPFDKFDIARAISVTTQKLVPPEPENSSDTAQTLGVRPYSFDLSPDLFFVLVSYDTIYGIVGGGYLTASDMLGDHNLSFYINFIPGYQQVVQADYQLLSGPVSVSLATFYRNTNYFLENWNSQQFASTYLDQDFGVMLQFRYPFSRFSRIEWGLGARKLMRELNSPDPPAPELVSTLGDSWINSLNIALVRDTMTYKDFEAYSGIRAQVASSYSDKFLGGTRNFVFHQAEFNFAWPMTFINRDSVLSGRIFGVDQTGGDKHIYYFGGAQVRGLSYSEYLAQKFAIASIQIRQPYIKNINATLWPFNFLLIKDAHLVFFYDVGIAPFEWKKTGWTDVRAGYGGGLRLHTFMFEKVLLNFRFDISQRTDKPGSTYYYFTLGQVF